MEKNERRSCNLPETWMDQAKERRKSYAMYGSRDVGRGRMSRVSVAGGTAPSVLREDNEHSISYVTHLLILLSSNLIYKHWVAIKNDFTPLLVFSKQ